jgi:hypothetical protein
MTTGGWITMFVSVGFVTVLLAWCVYKVLSTPSDIHSQTDIETHDAE